MDTNGLHIFAAVARTRSFSAAVPQLGLSAVTIARRITALEAEVGVLLFMRGPRGVRLTAAGRDLLATLVPWERAETDLRHRLSIICRSFDAKPVRVTGTEPVIAEIVAPKVGQLINRYPGIRLDLRVSNGVASLERDEADIALRFAKPTGDRLRMRRLRDFRLGLYRSAGLEGTWHDLPYIGFDPVLGSIPEATWARDVGLVPNVRATSTRALLAMVLAGVGTAVLPKTLARRHSLLFCVKDAPPVPDRTLWMMTHPDAGRRPPVRAVIDWLGECLCSE